MKLRPNVPILLEAVQGNFVRRRIQTQTERANVRVRRLNQSRTQPLPQLLARRLSAIIDSCNDAVIVKTLDAIIAAWNPAAERIYGYLAEEVIGKHIGLLFPPEKGEELAAVMEKLRNGERIERYETVHVRKDEARIDVSVTISPITGPGGKILGASVIARDITERKRAQERISH